MPGTDAWHGQTLKPVFLKHRFEPFDLAENLQAAIVNPQCNPQRQELQDMAHEGASYEDWPVIGQFIDQHTLRLKKWERTCKGWPHTAKNIAWL